MKVTQTFALPHPIERVAAVMIDPEFNVALEKLREGVVSSEFKMLRDGDTEKVFELRSREHKRTMTGGIDRSATVESVTTSRFDVARRRLTWDYRGEGGKMMRLGGVYSLAARGESETVFTHDVSIEVSVPILGKQIAKLIARQFETRDDRYERLWKEFLDKEPAL
jgi:hypothetical protein